jgi:uncharacterized protein YggE
MRRSGLVVMAAVAAGLLAACGPQRDARALARDEVLLSVTAVGRAETRPDEARFSAGVSSLAPTAEGASAATTAKINAVVAALKGLGVTDDDLRTRSLSVQRVDARPGRERFEASNVIEVRVRRVDRTGAAVAAVTGAGANVLSGPDLRNADPEAAGRAAYADAYKAARARADAYAGAAGLEVRRVLTIRDGAGGGGVTGYTSGYEARDAAAQAAPVSVSPAVLAGTGERAVWVGVDFVLGEG